MEKLLIFVIALFIAFFCYAAYRFFDFLSKKALRSDHEILGKVFFGISVFFLLLWAICIFTLVMGSIITLCWFFMGKIN